MTKSMISIVTVLITVWTISVNGNSKSFHGFDIIGVWQNQLNSTFNVSHVDDITMELRGTYSSPSGTTGLFYPAIGYVNWLPAPDPSKDSVTVVSFSVRWGTFGSVTTWNGIMRDNGILIAQWLLVRPVTSYIWDHVHTGQDTFIKV